jgi:ferritin-like metal-binding protein YciE
MGLFTKDIETMDDLLLHGLQDIYYAENQIVKSLPKLIEKATNRDLTKGLRDHLEETKNQIVRLDQVFKKLGQEPKGGRPGRGHRRIGAVGRALRNRPLWHPDRVG